jgi:hypothetical protein
VALKIAPEGHVDAGRKSHGIYIGAQASLNREGPHPSRQRGGPEYLGPPAARGHTTTSGPSLSLSESRSASGLSKPSARMFSSNAARLGVGGVPPRVWHDERACGLTVSVTFPKAIWLPPFASLLFFFDFHTKGRKRDLSFVLGVGVLERPKE